MKKMLFLLLLLCFVAAAVWNYYPHRPLKNMPQIDKVLIEKSARRMHLLSDGKKVRSYQISLGRNPVGHKQKEGDKKTPEGTYYISHHNPNSSYYLSLGISYPNEADRKYAQENGWQPGSHIMIHGLPNRAPFMGRLHRFYDWTAGCIAVTNGEIKEIYAAVKDKTPVEIRP